MSNRLKCRRTDDGDTTIIRLDGVIDEETDLESLAVNLRPTVRFDLERVTRINSFGVREWINMVQSLGERHNLEFTRCSVPVVEQLNMISNFFGGGTVVSFYAPYICPNCDGGEVEMLLTTEEVVSNRSGMDAPPRKCPSCGGAMEFDDVEMEYFLFLECGETHGVS